ncbi:eukaryotic aspartyl protease (macronuclear) [Tetrahymena thermophila SB210]|uniref:Eukaryotic aspartyl protease n=1 Tax=Tetrahymena thermophila (strain SB210) TaxID=312017 RepID=Q24HM4_TETTS|nr:eukaryotic aspartyl protease [Tetrahymena thermophila SB210]EAS07287.1 eukaryotic aspartyl protease [Tetrahymena thermophila SB210]|eukprot:XP_001027529.1 eukaryotic aspartyl protease [Tetrahymena thermophila SB210]
MQKISKIAIGSLVLFLILAALVEAKAKTNKNIKLELKRNVLNAWQKNTSNAYANDFCFSPKHSRPSRPLIFNTEMPSNCSQSKVARISQECVFKNLAYNARFYYDKDESSNTTSIKDVKKLEASQDFFELAIDLTSPWSWVKSPVCQTCDRKGKNCKQNQCLYKNNSTKSSHVSKVFSSTNLKVIEKCGEIDQYAEGMSVVGQFITPEKLRIKDTTQFISKPKLLWAHALSGQHFLLADGVLGLGADENENAITIQNLNQQKGNQKSQENFREDDSPKDDYYEDEDDEEEEEEDDNNEEDVQQDKNNNNKNQAQNKDTQQTTSSKRVYEIYEPEMNMIEPIVKQYKQVQNKTFSLYIADDDQLTYQLIIGDIMQQYIYKPESNQIQYLRSLSNAELVDQYGLWVVYVSKIRIAKQSEELKNKKKNKEQPTDSDSESTDGLLPINSVNINNPVGILSLTTTAIVLPEKDLVPILNAFQNEFGIKCSISKEYLFFVVCEEISANKEELNDMAMIIEIGQVFIVHLQVNPADLILDCVKVNKSRKDSKLKCQMNLQQSYDNKIILGEAALRNQYMVFDQKESLIGFAPAKNKFNSSSFIKRIGHLFNKIEQVIEQDISYIVAFLVLIILSAAAFLVFRHGKTIFALFQGKRVIVVDDKNDRIQLSQHAHETMDESAIRELQEMSQQMEDQGIQNHDFNAQQAEHPNDVLKPVDLEDL